MKMKIKKKLSKTLADIMNENLSGVTVKDVQNGSFQKNLITEALQHHLFRRVTRNYSIFRWCSYK